MLESEEGALNRINRSSLNLRTEPSACKGRGAADLLRGAAPRIYRSPAEREKNGCEGRKRSELLCTRGRAELWMNSREAPGSKTLCITVSLPPPKETD